MSCPFFFFFFLMSVVPFDNDHHVVFILFDLIFGS
jgi:hypothetical protein